MPGLPQLVALRAVAHPLERRVRLRELARREQLGLRRARQGERRHRPEDQAEPGPEEPAGVAARAASGEPEPEERRHRDVHRHDHEHRDRQREVEDVPVAEELL